MEEEMRLLDDEGRRLDGRLPDELRPIKMDVNVLNRADGSAYVEWGKNKVLAAVYGPRETHPRHLQNPQKAIVQCRYNMAPFSVSDRKRPGPDRRSVEISKVVAEAFEHVVFTELYPRASIDIYIEILEANAGTRCVGITAASLALADAGIPMKGLVAACAAGKVAGRVVLDLMKEEDNLGEADLPIAYLPRTKEIVLLQMDGDMTEEEFKEALDMAIEAAERIHEMQKETLRRKYALKAEEVREVQEVAE